MLFQYIFEVQEHITTVFVFAVFLVSLFTDGYGYGVCAAFVGTVAVNYAFTFPYFSLNFTIWLRLPPVLFCGCAYGARKSSADWTESLCW